MICNNALFVIPEKFYFSVHFIICILYLQIYYDYIKYILSYKSQCQKEVGKISAYERHTHLTIIYVLNLKRIPNHLFIMDLAFCNYKTVNVYQVAMINVNCLCYYGDLKQFYVACKVIQNIIKRNYEVHNLKLNLKICLTSAYFFYNLRYQIKTITKQHIF